MRIANWLKAAMLLAALLGASAQAAVATVVGRIVFPPLGVQPRR